MSFRLTAILEAIVYPPRTLRLGVGLESSLIVQLALIQDFYLSIRIALPPGVQPLDCPFLLAGSTGVHAEPQAGDGQHYEHRPQAKAKPATAGLVDGSVIVGMKCFQWRG